MGATAIIKGVTGLVQQILPRFLTDKDKVLEVGKELELELAKSALDRESVFGQFVLAYEGTAESAGPVITFIRSIIRPLLTLAIVAAYLWGFLHPDKFNPTQLGMLNFAMLLVLGFWFGERAFKNAAPAISGILDSLKKKGE